MSPSTSPVQLTKPFDADKAIIVLTLRRLANTAGLKNHGANRDDHPMFTQICEDWLMLRPVDRDVLFQARYRVRKYRHQVVNSSWWAESVEDKNLSKLLEWYRELRDANNPILMREIADHIYDITGYGGW